MAKNTLPFYPDPLITGQSMAASFVGTPTNIEFADNVGIQVSWTGSNPIGVVGVNISLDYDKRFPAQATWTVLKQPDGVTPVTLTPAGTAGNGYMDLNQLSAMWVQVSYTTAGGSVGNLTSKIGYKGLQ